MMKQIRMSGGHSSPMKTAGDFYPSLPSDTVQLLRIFQTGLQLINMSVLTILMYQKT